ncbi:uncharacterized protein N7515_001285 [Penicillium bovifimosum]|uniref:Uncharacterized protein n=1 Tax=Penicillium bovifimosum TaxID=126998 RepID=A0A9W9H9Q3_9EURO|nr:uncharacterized protein N7515_001285 [Penicillium bovifimosum]KAJ5142498.1 hypothetical protein N7515_001285 [Penicillium bovifimosum]
MELHHSTEKQTSNLQTIITARLSDFVRELTPMIETVQFGRLQFTDGGYNALESATRDLAKLSNSIADEVKALGKRRASAVVTEGQKLLSRAETTKAELMKSQKTRGLVFIRNIQLFFNPPAASKLDSPTVQKRKQLTRERSERLRSLAPNKMILWAAAFPPSVWNSNVLQKSTFDFVVEFLEPGHSLQWPAHIYEILHTLAVEQPLCNSSHFREFLTDMDQSAGVDQTIPHSSSQEGQTLQSDVPGVDGK